MKVGLKKPESLGYMTVDTCVLYKTFCNFAKLMKIKLTDVFGTIHS